MPMSTSTEHWLNVNGARLYAVAEGRGPRVLLVHGFPELAYS